MFTHTILWKGSWRWTHEMTFESMFWEKSTWQLNASSKSSRIPFWYKKTKQEVQGKPGLISGHISKKQQKRTYDYKLTSSPKWCNENMFFWLKVSLVGLKINRFFVSCVSFPIKQTFTPLTRKKQLKTLRWKLRYFNCWPYELARHAFVQWVYIFFMHLFLPFHVPWTKLRGV